MMGAVKGVDRQRLDWGRSTRISRVTSVALGTARGLLVGAQAWLLATVVGEAFIGGRSLSALRLPMALLLAVVVLRASVTWWSEVSADRCSARVKSEMREWLVERVAFLGPQGQPTSRSGDVATLAVRGI